MPSMKRHKTQYPGVKYVLGTDPRTGKQEKIFYIRYRRRDGRQVEEKAGRAGIDDMTAARAARLRSDRMGGEPTNQERRDLEEQEAQAEAQRWTFDRLWAEYERQKSDNKGMVTDRNRYHNHLSPAFGDKEPREIAPLDVDRLKSRLAKKRKLKPGTIRNVLELFRRLVNFGTRKQLCEGLSFTVRLPRVNNQKTEDLTDEQLRNLLEAIEQEPNRQVAHLMLMVLYTGMRRGELFRLKWADIEWERKKILIREPKGGVDQRIPLGDDARDLLKSHPRIEGSEYVFPGRDGAQRVDCIKQVNKIKERAGLGKDFRGMHGLRHAYASALASSGQVDMYRLQKLLTHKSPTMTQRYTHLRDEALQEAANLAGSIVGQAKASTAQKQEASAGSVVNLDAKRPTDGD